MSHLTGKDHSRYVQQLFGRIAKRYDMLNRLMTFGQDTRWRKKTIHNLGIQPDGLYLDLGAGTGDLASEILMQEPSTQVVACDFSREMILVGRARPRRTTITWVIGDAEHLPFSRQSFDGVVSGFLMRNVSNLDQSLLEQYRVVKEYGKVVCLDTTPPRKNITKSLVFIHMDKIIPILGILFAGDRAAYEYLPASTHSFLTAGAFADRMRQAGFAKVSFAYRMFGTIAIHSGVKTPK